MTTSNTDSLTRTEPLASTQPLASTEPVRTEPLNQAEAAGSGERAVPYYCPYCGEEDLRPEPEPRAAWRCVGCTRVFVVRFVGLSVPGVTR
jgi:transposase-like protein